MEYYFECDAEQLPFCCGVRELGAFSALHDFSNLSNHTGTGGTPEEAAQALIKEVSNSYEEGYVFQTWFVRRVSNEEYDHNAIREVVQKIPGVLHLGTHINPNTGNTIDGYIWMNKHE